MWTHTHTHTKYRYIEFAFIETRWSKSRHERTESGSNCTQYYHELATLFKEYGKQYVYLYTRFNKYLTRVLTRDRCWWLVVMGTNEGNCDSNKGSYGNKQGRKDHKELNIFLWTQKQWEWRKQFKSKVQKQKAQKTKSYWKLFFFLRH